MRTLIFIFLLIPLGILCQVSDSLTLLQCYKFARDNYPLAKQIDLISNASELRTTNLENNFLPQIYLNGQASYQSDVTSIPIKLPNITIPEIYKDQYKISLDLNQVIYDGGNTRLLKKAESVSTNTDKQNVEIELNKLKELVNQDFFNILLLQQNEKMLQLSLEDLKSRLAKVESGISNGVMIKSNADIFSAEILKIEQQLTDLEFTRNSCLKRLGDLLDKDISGQTFFKLPELNSFDLKFSNNRPEVKNFALLREKTEVYKELTKTRNRPKISAIAQVGYGRPGFNMFYPDFDKFYFVAAKLSWNLWDWRQTGRERQVFDIQNKMVDTEHEVFDKSIKMALEKEIADISKYEELLRQDDKLIEVRNRIVNTASSQLDNGIITSTEYLTEYDNSLQTKLNLEIHKIQLLKAKINYLNITGNL